jgi:predicted small lipoprotein YifL
MRRLFAPLVILAAVLAGCGQSNPKLIPQSNADALTATADKIQAACDAQDRTVARREIRNAEREIDALPSSVDADLRKNLQDWIDQIQSRITADCKAEEQETPTPSPEETETAEPTETPTATETAAPTETATEAPTDTATPAPTDTPAPTETATAAPTTTPDTP